MANSRSPNEKYNESGYADGTAYLALQNVKREERKKNSYINSLSEEEKGLQEKINVRAIKLARKLFPN